MMLAVADGRPTEETALSNPAHTAAEHRARQRAELHALLRGAPLDLAGDPIEQRPIFSAMLASAPLPPETTTSSAALGGVPVKWAETPGSSQTTVLYFHGGGYAIGDAHSALGTPATIAALAGCRAVAVGYRLAPESPFPAALDDAVAAYRALLDLVPATDVVIAGDSAGGGLALATMLAARETGMPLPRAAVLFSPWTDLTLSGTSVQSRADADPTLTASALDRSASRYLAGADATDPLASPLLAELAGLPPLFLTVGTDEILLDDTLRLAAKAAASGVVVSLEVGPGLTHVYPTFYSILDEGAEALAAAARFIESTRVA